MERYVKKSAFSVIAIFVLGFSLLFMTTDAFAGQARILDVKNAVLIQRAHDGATEVAKVNSVLNPGDQVETLNEASAAIEIGERGHVELNEKTKWEFTSLEEGEDGVFIEGKILLGELKADFKKFKDASKFEIITPTSVAAVRGTGFFLHVYNDVGTFYTRIEVYDGVVAFSGLDRLNPVDVKAGESRVYVGGSIRQSNEDMSDVQGFVQKEWFGTPYGEFRHFKDEVDEDKDEDAPIISEPQMSK